MSFLPRAAVPAATFLILLSLVASSTPGWALDKAGDYPAIATTSAVINPSTAKPVPSLDMSDDSTTTPDEVRSASPALGTVGNGVGSRFASLAAAVAARDIPGSVDSELSCLAGAIYFESKGEPLSGQLAVANVVINRSTSGRFPGSICGVVKQPGQFSFVRRGSIPAIRSAAQYRTAMAVAQIAMDKQWDNPAPKALYFHARYVSPGWNRARVTTIGNHIFFR